MATMNVIHGCFTHPVNNRHLELLSTRKLLDLDPPWLG